MPPDPPREQGPEGLATPTQINATPTSKTVENPDAKTQPVSANRWEDQYKHCYAPMTPSKSF